MGNRIFGCDDCLAVCPWNKFAQGSREAKLAVREASDNPPLAELLVLDDAAFRARFAGTPIKRTGRDRFLRNVLIAAGNSGDAALVPLVEARLDDGSPLVRAMAVWALARLAPDRFGALRARGAADPDAVVRGEWMDRGGVSRLFAFGLGFSAQELASRLAGRGFEIAGTARDEANLTRLAARGYDVTRFAGEAGNQRRDAPAARDHPYRPLDSTRPRRRSRAGALPRPDRDDRNAGMDRLSLDRRRLWRPGRALGRGDDADQAEQRPDRGAGRGGSGLARIGR